MNGEWISTTDAALRLKVTPRHIRNKMMEIYQSGSDGVRKVVGSRGNPRWELNEDILHLFPNRGNKKPTKGKLKRKNKEELKGENNLGRHGKGYRWGIRRKQRGKIILPGSDEQEQSKGDCFFFNSQGVFAKGLQIAKERTGHCARVN
jgi:hypothetical protein